MATKINLAGSSGNPGMRLGSTSDRDRIARRGVIGEWDMLTISGGTQLDDLSGNANHFVFSAAPTTDAEGWVADGTTYADMTLAAALTTDYSFAIVYKTSGTGFHIFGNASVSGGTGLSIRMHTQQRLVGPATNEAYITGSGWKGMLAVVDQKHARFRNLSGGLLDTTHMLREFSAAELAAMPATWRIGGQGVGGALTSPAPAGAKVSYLMMFDTVVDFNQSTCLSEYIAEKMAARGVTYT
jgi:hypothetical protein